MAASLHALSDDKIAAGRLGGPALVDRAVLPRNESTSTMASPHKALVNGALEELDDHHVTRCFRYDLDRWQIWDQEADA
jgi:hypothetical protein